MQLEPPPEFDSQNPAPADLVWAYRHGIFPMANPFTGELEWFSPEQRGVIPLERFHVPGNLAKEVRRAKFSIQCDQDFQRVMRECSEPRAADNLPWIDERLIACYERLHRAGHAHSVEAWLGDDLVGGLYGVHIGAAFFGESMFSRPQRGGSNASKICLVHLVAWLRERRFTLLDTQFVNDHLRQFGVMEIPQQEYLRQLDEAAQRALEWGQFEPLAAQAL